MKSSAITPEFDVLSLTQALICCPTVTPEEAGAMALLEQVLTPFGFHVERPVFCEEGTPNVENFFARLGTEGPVLAFAGHTDVVPVGNRAAWSVDPFAGALISGQLIGRGAIDMKGGIAAFVIAMLRFVAQYGPPVGSVVFLITGD